MKTLPKGPQTPKKITTRKLLFNQVRGRKQKIFYSLQQYSTLLKTENTVHTLRETTSPEICNIFQYLAYINRETEICIFFSVFYCSLQISIIEHLIILLSFTSFHLLQVGKQVKVSYFPPYTTQPQ